VKNLIPTIIISAEVHAEIRGYNLQGREFVLKEPHPRKDEAITLDGARMAGDYWVVSKDEFMRVVPEAAGSDFNSDEVYIPTFVAQISFRPAYIRPKMQRIIK
jgi:hypothetical protein